MGISIPYNGNEMTGAPALRAVGEEMLLFWFVAGSVLANVPWIEVCLTSLVLEGDGIILATGILSSLFHLNLVIW